MRVETDWFVLHLKPRVTAFRCVNTNRVSAAACSQRWQPPLGDRHRIIPLCPSDWRPCLRGGAMHGCLSVLGHLGPTRGLALESRAHPQLYCLYFCLIIGPFPPTAHSWAWSQLRFQTGKPFISPTLGYISISQRISVESWVPAPWLSSAGLGWCLSSCRSNSYIIISCHINWIQSLSYARWIRDLLHNMGHSWTILYRALTIYQDGRSHVKCSYHN